MYKYSKEGKQSQILIREVKLLPLPGWKGTNIVNLVVGIWLGHVYTIILGAQAWSSGRIAEQTVVVVGR